MTFVTWPDFSFMLDLLYVIQSRYIYCYRDGQLTKQMWFSISCERFKRNIKRWLTYTSWKETLPIRTEYPTEIKANTVKDKISLKANTNKHCRLSKTMTEFKKLGVVGFAIFIFTSLRAHSPFICLTMYVWKISRYLILMKINLTRLISALLSSSYYSKVSLQFKNCL